MESKYRRVLILLHDTSWGRTLFRTTRPDPGCEVTMDLSRLREADAVVFHIPTAPDLGRIKKRPGQKWVAWSLESDVYYPQLRDAAYMAQFDLTMTYRWDSDVPVGYFGPDLHLLLAAPPQPKTASAAAVYFTSNFYERSGRTAYVRELMRHLPVDSLGRAYRNRELAGPDDGRETKLRTIARYRFNLAFENSISRDYVSEKFFDPLVAGSVPVYRGAPNIDEVAPGDHCYIDAANFGSPAELGEYLLHLAGNPAEYEEYLAWKRRPFREGFLKRSEILGREAFYRLGDKLRQFQTGSVQTGSGL